MEEKQPEEEEAAETPDDSDFWAAPAWAGSSIIDGAVSLIQTVDKEIAQSSPEEQKQMRHALKAMTKCGPMEANILQRKTAKPRLSLTTKGLTVMRTGRCGERSPR